MSEKNIYEKIWELAKPHYLSGRPMDVDHIEWMMWDAMMLSEKEDVDLSILLPLAILHDVWYSRVPKDNPFNLDLRAAHMKEWAVIAKEILENIWYPEDKIEKISYFVSVHDNWALWQNDLYKENLELWAFNDLDYMWMATPKWFPALMTILKKDKEQMIEFLETNEKLINRPFATKTTKGLYEDYLDDRRK
jgi:hypothetical protein